jgi:hypothetical protein
LEAINNQNGILVHGKINHENDVYQATHWLVDTLGNTYLLPNQPVTVAGFLENNTNLADSEQYPIFRVNMN